MSAFAVRRLFMSGTAGLALAAAPVQVQAQEAPTPAPTPAPSASRATPASTEITNTAQASYSVNGTAQTATSNTARFVVDRKVNLTVVALQTANTPVNLGETGAVIPFRVTNLTNAKQDILLDPDQTLSLGPLIGTDDFDMNNLKAFVDNGDGEYKVDDDTETYIDELAPDASVTVFLVGDVPAAGSPNLSIVNLHVIAAAGGTPNSKGLPLVQTNLNLLNAENEVDVVFADADTDGAGRDVERDGEARAYLAYQIGNRNVDLTVLKTQRVVSDGLNSLNPRALPGAEIEYCLTVRNGTLLTAAKDVTLTDLIPDHTTYVPGSISVGGLGTGGVCVLNGQSQDDDADDDNDPSTYRGSYDPATRKVTAIIPTLAGGISLNASFRVTID